MNSASEGMYYGVPLIVIPQAQDQFYVAKRVTRLKAGKMLLMKIALSIYGSAIPFAAIAGQVGAGLLLQANILGLSWRPLFLINVPLGIVTLAAAAILLERRSTITHTRLIQAASPLSQRRCCYS